MFVKDHPPPHFHAIYGEQEARISIATGEPIEGELPVRAKRLIRDWANLHNSDLEANWRRLESMLPPERIEPLP